ncbi:MAG: hypothetical protein AABZ60_05650, partial [Planctomycetota bacterium]
PTPYNGELPYGLIVWVDAGDSGNPPLEWHPILDRYRLIWIGALNSGNERNSLTRYGLAIDAVENMKKLYLLEPKRIYISGISGGGRVSSRLALSYPDVFTGGGLYLIGCNYYRNLPTPDKKVFPGFWPKPKKELLTLAKKNRFVLLTGSQDFNQAQTKLVYDAYLQDEFSQTLYIEIPEMEHTLPSLEWVEKAILFLDQSVRESAERYYQQAHYYEEKKQFGEALKAYYIASCEGFAQAFAEDSMKKVQELKPYYEEKIKKIQVQMEQGSLKEAQVALKELQKEYAPFAQEEMALLMKTIQSKLAKKK